MVSKRSFKLLVVSSTTPFSAVWQLILSLIVEVVPQIKTQRVDWTLKL